MTDTELKNLVIRKIKELINFVKKDFPVLNNTEFPEIKFTKRGRVAGCVEYNQNTASFNFNMVLLRENPDEFIKQTVPHETAHFIVFSVYGVEYDRGGRRIIHGKKWKNMMVYLGVDPKRCHSYNVDNCTVRKLKTFAYVCGCREHELTSIRHNKILKKGAHYTCSLCGKRLVRK